MERLECGLRELKFSGDGAAMTFNGYGAVFGNIDSYGDTIAKGAFSKTIAEAKSTGQWPAMLEQHGGWGVTASDMTPIGVWTDMSEDDFGLKLDGKFAPTPRGQEMHALMKMEPRPAINGLSIGFIPVKWRMRSSPEEPRRTLEEVRLLEISPVTFPANGKARVHNVKHEFDLTEILSLQDAEAILRDAGFSRNDAVAFVSRIRKMGQSDSDPGAQSDSVSAELLRALQSRAVHIPT